MVSDNREKTTFRICPDVTEGGAERPLFQQHISLPTCLTRQGRQYHKCHRCAHAEAVYAGVSNVRITAN